MSEQAAREARKQQALNLIKDRQISYKQVFDGDANVASQAIMKDLEKFCRKNESCFHADPRIHAALEGRREVVLRINDYLTLSTAELCRKYAGEEL